MSKTKIEWTDHTWNVVIGCSKVSAGCKNCYAEKMSVRLSGMNNKCSPDYAEILRYADYGKPLGFNGNVKMLPERLEQPLRWKKSSMVFVNSMSDLFHEDVPFEFIDEVFKIIVACPKHTFQILTKRPERMKEYWEWTKQVVEIEYADNIWLGVSVENKLALHRISILESIAVATRFISFEPLLEDLDFLFEVRDRGIDVGKIHWCVIGCESGVRKRDCRSEWVEDLVAVLESFEIPVFVKQLQINGKVVKDMEQFPEHLQIREYPS